MGAALLLAVVAVSLAARIALLRARPLWHDEAFTEWAARLPPAGLVAALRADSGPPLFYLLERPFAKAVSSRENEGLLRVLPFAAALALLLAARTLPPGSARRWWIALCSGFALVNLYAAEARAYALLALAGLAVFLLGALAPQTPGRLAALFAAAAAALWIHYLALFAVASALALALRRRRARAALVLVAALAAFAPWLPILRGQPREAMAWMREAPSATLPGFVSALGGVGRIPAPFGLLPPPAAVAAGALLGAALVVLLAAAARRDEAVRDALFFVLIALLLALATFAARPVAFAGRCEMAVLPVWMWAVARAAGERRSVAVLAGLSTAAGLLVTVLVAFGPHPRSTPASAAASVAHLARPADRVLAGPGFYLPALVEAGRGRLAARVSALPEGDAAHPGWFVAWPLRPEDARRAADAAEGVGSGGRLFLLLPPAYARPELMDPLARTGTLRELVRQPDGVLTVWTRTLSGPLRGPTDERGNVAPAPSPGKGPTSARSRAATSRSGVGSSPRGGAGAASAETRRAGPPAARVGAGSFR